MIRAPPLGTIGNWQASGVTVDVYTPAGWSAADPTVVFSPGDGCQALPAQGYIMQNARSGSIPTPPGSCQVFIGVLRWRDGSTGYPHVVRFKAIRSPDAQ